MLFFVLEPENCLGLNFCFLVKGCPTNCHVTESFIAWAEGRKILKF